MPSAPDRPCHLWLVVHDTGLRDRLGPYLQQQGLAVSAMASAEALQRHLAQARPDLIVMDVHLPGVSGRDACARLRRAGDRVPLILVDACADEVDRVLGLEMGADDCLGPVVSARELLARVRAVLRRVSLPPPPAAAVHPGAVAAAASAFAPAPASTPAPVRIGDYVFEALSRCLHRGNEVRVLNAVEYALLAELSAHPSVPLSRERLLAVSRTRHDGVLPRAVDAAIMRLRKAVEPLPATPRYIHTVRGHGYMFVPGGEARTD